MIGAAARTTYDSVAELEPHIASAQQIARLLHALASSRDSLECEALGPLADALSGHVEHLEASFRELHKLTGGAA